jgi:uncharacterized cupredoxin-like copper-binding protein
MRAHRQGRSVAGLLGLALVAAVPLSACSPAGGAPAARTVAVTIHYSHFSPAHLSVAAGETVRFTITNADPIDHEFILGDQSVQDREEAGTDRIHDGSMPGMVSAPAGTTVATVVTFPRHPARPSLIYACHLPGHYAYGMRGALQVTS